MIEIDNIYISNEITKSYFVCDLAKCKSACCKDGKYGAPIDKDEINILNDLYDTVKTYLPEKNIQHVKKYGLYGADFNDEPCLGMVEEKECVFAGTEANGNLFCAIEKAWLEKKISFRKPISCHLYPIRIQKYVTKERLYYHQWKICKPACKNGKNLQVPLYKFSKNALIRKYGEHWYSLLEEKISGIK